MNDDLGRHLRDEVPPPRAGYWESIDAALEDISEEDSDTTDTVVRPIGMNERRNDLSTRLMAVAAAVAVIAAAGVFIATRDGGDTQTDIATETPDNPTTTVEVSEEAEAVEVDELGFPLLDESSTRQCYADFVAGESVLVAEFGDNGSLRAASVDRDGQLSEVSIGEQFGADGWFVMTTQPAQGASLDYVSAWLVGEGGLSQGEDVGFEDAGCVPENEGMVAAAFAAQGAEPPAAANPMLAPGSVCFANQTDHPGADWIRIDVNDDLNATLAARYDFDDGSSILQTGVGFFVTDTNMAFDLQQGIAAAPDEDSRVTEIFVLEEAGVSFGLGFYREGVDCAEVDAQLAEIGAGN